MTNKNERKRNRVYSSIDMQIASLKNNSKKLLFYLGINFMAILLLNIVIGFQDRDTDKNVANYDDYVEEVEGGSELGDIEEQKSVDILQDINVGNMQSNSFSMDGEFVEPVIVSNGDSFYSVAKDDDISVLYKHDPQSHKKEVLFRGKNIRLPSIDNVSNVLSFIGDSSESPGSSFYFFYDGDINEYPIIGKDNFVSSYIVSENDIYYTLANENGRFVHYNIDTKKSSNIDLFIKKPVFLEALREDILTINYDFGAIHYDIAKGRNIKDYDFMKLGFFDIKRISNRTLLTGPVINIEDTETGELLFSGNADYIKMDYDYLYILSDIQMYVFDMISGEKVVDEKVGTLVDSVDYIYNVYQNKVEVYYNKSGNIEKEL